jgi:hypothetical protein
MKIILAWILRKPVVMLLLLVFLVVPVFALLGSLIMQEDTLQDQQGIENQLSPDQPRDQTKNAQISGTKTVMGKTTDEEILRIPNIKIESKEDKNTKYSHSSFLVQRPNRIETENGVAIFESVLVPPGNTTLGFATISSIKTTYGDPEESIKGSSYYGTYLYTYIYAGKGAAFIVNPNTDEVYEAHFFTPTTVESYRERFGADIDPEQNESHSF